MRWKRKLDPHNGQRRIRRVWLLSPLTIKGESRWLEWAWIEQVYERGGSYAFWVDHAWADGPAMSTEPVREDYEGGAG